jgi:AcrR family transcriptional regulator
MMAMMTTVHPSTKEQMVLAGERLFAEHGYNGVSLREIGVAAGRSNASVAQYHFGTKEPLVAAIFDRRSSHIDSRRLLVGSTGYPAARVSEPTHGSIAGRAKRAVAWPFVA